MKKIFTLSVLAFSFLCPSLYAQTPEEQQTINAAQQARARAKAVQQQATQKNNVNNINDVVFEPLIIRSIPTTGPNAEAQNTMNAAKRANNNAKTLQQFEKDQSIFLTQPIPIIVAPPPLATEAQQTIDAAQRANANAKNLQNNKSLSSPTQVLTVTPSGIVLPAPRTAAQQTIDAAQRANTNAKALQNKQKTTSKILTVTPVGTILPAPRTAAQQTINAAQRANTNAKALQNKNNITSSGEPLLVVQPDGTLAPNTHNSVITDAQRANSNAKALQTINTENELVISPSPTIVFPISDEQKALLDAQNARARAKTNTKQKDNPNQQNIIVVQPPNGSTTDADATINAARRANNNAKTLTTPEQPNEADTHESVVILPPNAQQTEAQQTIEAARLARARAKATALRKKNKNAVVIETQCGQINLGNAASQFGETGTNASVSTQGGVLSVDKCINR